ncbi:MAG: trigger factor [Deltaproteobacteria bacterium]|nr:trigger factor [Deltaproteobacteria bacterium]
MKVTVQKHNDLEQKLSIEVPEVDIQSKIDEVLKKLQKKVKIRGFRPGKVPLEVVKKFYHDNARSEALDDLINESYKKAINEHHLEVIAHPRIENLEFEEGKPLKYTAYVEVHPEVPLKKYKGLSLVRNKLKEVTSKEIDETLDHMRQSRGELTTLEKDRPTQEGDYLMCLVTIHEVFLTPKIKEFLKKLKLEKGYAHSYMILVDKKNDLGKQCIRKNKNEEFEIKLKLPEDLKKEIKTSEELPLKVVIQEMKTLKLPELNDDFAKLLGKYKDLKEVKEEIKKYLEGQRRGEVDQKLRDDLLEKLVEENPLQLPSQLLNRHEEQVKKVAREDLLKSQFTEEEINKYLKENAKKIKDRAYFELKISMLLHKVAHVEKLEVTEKDLQTKLAHIASHSGVSLEEVVKTYQEKGWFSQLHRQVEEGKTIEHLLKEASVKEAVK